MEDTVTVMPKTTPLGPAELVSARSNKIDSIKFGPKKTKPTGSPDETEQLNLLLENWSKQVSNPRLDRINGRSQGIWDPDRGAVKVVRKERKFDNFGYWIVSEHFLEYYEALFLLELNRLEILHNSMRLSIEQGYHLLLGEDESENYHNYLIYSTFTRSGYIVRKYRNIKHQFESATENQSEPATRHRPQVTTVDDCIWSVMLNLIHGEPLPDHVKNSSHFSRVEHSMNTVRESIINQTPVAQRSDEEDVQLFHGKMQPTKVKRKTEDIWHKMNWINHHSSFVDFLTEEESYKLFAEHFESFDIIQLKEDQKNVDITELDLRIQFDIFLHNENSQYKGMNPKAPIFRVVILKKNETFPNRSEILRCYLSQVSLVPILVCTVSDSKQIQAFLYYVSPTIKYGVGGD